MNFSSELETEVNLAEINVTPLLDVTFSLIMFFMLTTTFMQAHSIDVSLPQSSSAKEITASREMLITINDRSEILVDDKKIDLNQLREKLKNWKNHKPINSTLIIWGDRVAQHGTIVSVMDLANSEGIEQISIATNPK